MERLKRAVMMMMKKTSHPRLHWFTKRCQLLSALVCSVGKQLICRRFAHTADETTHQLIVFCKQMKSVESDDDS